MTLPISVNGLNGVRQWEGRALRAYRDEVGVWTIGYGITNNDKGIGFAVKAGATITAAEAETLLYKSLLDNYAPDVKRALDPSKCPHPQDAQDAGMSFHYNTGGIRRAGWPKALMAGNLSTAKANLESWNKGGGHVISGLVRRRAWEWNVIANENYGHMTGPEELNERERAIGTGELLTAFPLLPGQTPDPVVPGSIKEDGVPIADTPAPGALKVGSAGPEVIEVQRDLVKAGYHSPVTGTFDAATAAQVTKYQEAHPHLTADGTVGPATSTTLTRQIALQAKVGKVAKVAPLVPVAAGGLWQWVHAQAGEIALVAGIVVLAGALVWVVWTYRSEIEANFNKAIGRITI